MYTEASWEVVECDGNLEWIDAGLGGILFDEGGHGIAYASQLAQRWLDSEGPSLPLLNPRKTQIVMCETVASLDMVDVCLPELHQSELRVSIDNIALVCAYVPHSDLQAVGVSWTQTWQELGAVGTWNGCHRHSMWQTAPVAKAWRTRGATGWGSKCCHARLGLDTRERLSRRVGFLHE